MAYTKTPILVIVFCLCSIISEAAVRGTNRRADLNHDDEVNIADVNLVLNDIMQDTNDLALCDINSDGIVNVADLNEVLNIIFNPDIVHEPAEYVSGTLPVMHVNTAGYRTINSKEHYWQGEYWLEANGSTKVLSIGSESSPLPLEIKGRGNYTWITYPKKQYKVKLTSKAELIANTAKSKHYALQARYDDWRGYMLDAVAFQISRRIGMNWASHEEPIELVVNGDYCGLYFLTETVRVQTGRVDITEQKDLEMKPQAVTGGWLVEHDNYIDDNQIIFDGMLYTYHSPEVLSSQQREYLQTLISNVIDAIKNRDLSTDNEWEELIDIDEYAKYCIVQEIMDNQEGYAGSCYWHKERGDNSKIVFGPVWDFGFSLRRTGEQKFSWQDNGRPIGWMKYLKNSPSLMACIRKHWQEFSQDGFDWIDNFIDNYALNVNAATVPDNRRWPDSSSDQYLSRVNQLKYLIHLRLDFLNSQWGDCNPDETE